MRVFLQKIKISERNFAIVCAVVLVSLSVIAAVRHSENFQALSQNRVENEAVNKEMEKKLPLNDTPATQPAESETAPEETPATPTNPETPAPQSTAPTTDQAQVKPSTDQAQTKTAKDQVYDFVAAIGDTYTGFASNAISKHATEKNLSLSPEQTLLAEVELANQAGSPMLEIGQNVQIDDSQVASTLANVGVGTAVEPTAAAAKVQADKATEAAKAEPAPSQNPSAPSADKNQPIIATAGDNFIYIARNVIADHSASNKIELTDAQKVAAETKLAEQTGWQQIDVNQAVSVDASQLKSAVDFAKNLDENAQSQWQQYANVVSFN